MNQGAAEAAPLSAGEVKLCVRNSAQHARETAM